MNFLIGAGTTALLIVLLFLALLLPIAAGRELRDSNLGLKRYRWPALLLAAVIVVGGVIHMISF